MKPTNRDTLLATLWLGLLIILVAGRMKVHRRWPARRIRSHS